MKYLLLILLAGCTMDGGDVTPNFEFAQCTDTRDGEAFTLVGNTSRNGRIGIGSPTCIDIDDTTGRTRTMCSDNQWLKCEVN